MSAALAVDRITKRFGHEIAANDLSLVVGPGELVAVVGPSGSGKSTLLRLIAGLESPDSGTISLNGRDITTTPAHQRRCALVFQQYALFPHRTVRENIGFGLRMQGFDRQQATHRIDALIERVGLTGQGEKRPAALSGGQQQRVALARAFAVEPDALLLDEPFGALDLSLRRQLQDELRAIQQQDQRTTVHVTHDQGEALALADRIVVLDRGSIAQVGTPQEIYERPASRFVAGFMDFRNLLPVVVHQSTNGERSVELAGRAFDPGAQPVPPASPVVAAIRPEHVVLAAVDADEPNTWPGIVRDVAYAGSTHIHTVRLADGTLIEAHAPVAYPAGTPVSASLPSRYIVLLDA